MEEPPIYSPQPKRKCKEFIIRSPNLWFEDGNIVLQADITQFRVHKGLLIAHSPVFTKLLNLPPNQDATYVDGCPLVHLPDTAKEWTDMLMALYNIFESARYPDEYPIDRVLSLLRLGHRYQFEYFFKMSAERLKWELPCSRFYWGRFFRESVGETDDSFTKGHEFDLINAALEVGMKNVLPSVFFTSLQKYNVSNILKGIRRPDGTPTKLALSTQIILISAKAEIAKLAMEHVGLTPLRSLQNAHRDGTIMCERTTGGLCGERSAESDQWLLRSESRLNSASEDLRLGEMCGPCLGQLSVNIANGREKVWDALPAAFGLPPRSELEDV